MLGAIAMFGGALVNGEFSGNSSAECCPSLNKLAQETGLSLHQVRKATEELEDEGLIARGDAEDLPRVRGFGLTEAGLEDIVATWRDAPRSRISMPKRVRAIQDKRLSAKVLLVAGLVQAHADRSGQWRLRIEWITERLGIPRRTVDRCLVTAKELGLVYSKVISIRPGWSGRQLILSTKQPRLGMMRRCFGCSRWMCWRVRTAASPGGC